MRVRTSDPFRCPIPNFVSSFYINQEDFCQMLKIRPVLKCVFLPDHTKLFLLAISFCLSPYIDN